MDAMTAAIAAERALPTAGPRFSRYCEDEDTRWLHDHDRLVGHKRCEHPGRARVDKATPDGTPIYLILDNLSAHKGKTIRAWAARNKVELGFT
jgi:hypothetical protein